MIMSVFVGIFFPGFSLWVLCGCADGVGPAIASG